ncbi:MAG: RHS repeat domain-containing protein [Candidatus Binataceae bacterium]
MAGEAFVNRWDRNWRQRDDARRHTFASIIVSFPQSSSRLPFLEARPPRDREASARAITLLLAVILAAAALLAARPACADITYIYDAAGRLNYVINASGSVAQYVYDSDGNITQIAVSQPSLAIYQLSPSSGAVGTSVTIYGTGFSATPSQEAVSFNGTPATVTASTTTTITTSVPTGATTGQVSVTCPAGLVNGPTFTVQ